MNPEQPERWGVAVPGGWVLGVDFKPFAFGTRAAAEAHAKHMNRIRGERTYEARRLP